ncbi:MAG: glucosaminidase domain-containing protein, partial [Caulobacteraceae bacterium]|nr:glucosaminidase domain-containing protein [Caulobacteraceae bacterium]
SLSVLSLLPASGASAAPLFDVGPAGEVEAQAQAATAIGQAADLTIATVPATQTETHLPGWVQVYASTAALYAADSGPGDQVLAKLARNTYLRVLGGGTSRLQVQVYDADDTPAATGWIDADQVEPSAPATDWLVTSTPTTLWTASDASATQARSLDRFTPIQKLSGPELNRIQVRVYRSDFSGVLAQGWLDVSATGPALSPQARVPLPESTATRAGAATPTQQDFLDAAGGAARQAQALTGVPASVSVAQAILESDWGRSSLATGANNYFGMKAMGTLGNDGAVWLPTTEYDADGNLYQTVSAFRAYKSLADSVADHDRLLATLSRYAPAMQARSDPRAFAALIAQGGYSTDPAYADKLIALMDRYGLYSLDS